MSNERRSRLVRGRVSAISKTETNNKKVHGFRIPSSANALGIALIFEFFELSEMPALGFMPLELFSMSGTPLIF